MNVECLEKQNRELEAVSSFYEDRVHYFYEDGRIKGHLDVEFKPLELKSIIYMLVDEQPKCVTVSVLPPARIHFEMPHDYPETSDLEVTLECIWMNEKMIEKFHVLFNQTCKEAHPGNGQLFQCHDTVTNMVSHPGIDICIDFTPWVQSKQWPPQQVLQLVAELSEEADIHYFEAQCFFCVICLQDKTGRDCVRITPCAHVFCSDCMRSYITNKTRHAQIKQIICPDLLCHNSISQSLIKSIIGEQEFERYDKILLHQELSNMEDIVICPKRQCQQHVPVKPCGGNLGYCELCEHAFCLKCRKTYHGIEKCAGVDFKKSAFSESAKGRDEDEEPFTDREALVKAWEEKNEAGRKELAKHFGGMEKLKEIVETSQSESWIEENSKMCPSCFGPIEKTTGCNKMVCEKCHKYFCWLCGTILNKKDPYAHFRADGPCAELLFEVPDEDEVREGDEEDQ